MPGKTWFMTNTLLTTVFQEMSETSPGANATTSPAVGWTQGKGVTGVTDIFQAGVLQVRTNFANGAQPPAAIVTSASADCLRTTNTYNGIFDATNWQFTGSLVATTAGGNVRINYRLWKGSNAAGTNAVQLTSSGSTGSIIAMATSANNVTASFLPGAFTASNEYIFFQMACQVTTAGGSNSDNNEFVIGNTATRLISANFIAASASTSTFQAPQQGQLYPRYQTTYDTNFQPATGQCYPRGIGGGSF